MYCDFYKLTERPFNVTPDPKFLYLNARYREAIASLHYGITQRKGFITLIGEAGTGKTTLLKKLLDELDPKTRTVFIFNTNVTFEEILEYIFAEFDLPIHNGKKLYMLQRLNTFLLNELQNGGNVALLIDEAQDLEFAVLEDLRLLSNLETAKEKILQIVLSGQPELGQKLSNPVLRQLRQRIGINCRLLPLSREEISEYVRFRLQAAGSPDLKLFSREAEDQVYRFSHGIPRLVNVVCDNALVIGYALGRQRISAEIITEAAADLLAVDPSISAIATAEPPPDLDLPTAPVTVSPPPAAGTGIRWRSRLAVAALMVVAVGVGLFSMGRTMLSMRDGGDVPVAAPLPQIEVIRPGSQPYGSGVSVPEPAAVAAAPAGTDRAAIEQPVPVNRPAEVAADDVDVVVEAGDRGSAARVAVQRPAGEEVEIGGRGDGAGQMAAAVAPPALGRAEARGAEAPRPGSGARELVPSDRELAGAPPDGERAGRRPLAADPGSRVPPAAAPAPVAASAPEAIVRFDADDVVAEDDRIRPASPEGAPQLAGVPFTEKAVRQGDSLSQLAMQKYGQATPTILDMLKLANPRLSDVDVIPVGQTIRLPELSDGFPTLVDSSGKLALLVYSSPRNDRAQALQKALRNRGFDVRVTTGRFGAQKPIYRVVLPGFSDRSEVAATGRQLQKVLREDRQIARLGE